MVVELHVLALAAIVWLSVCGGMTFGMVLSNEMEWTVDRLGLILLWPLGLIALIPGAIWLIVRCIPVGLAARAAASRHQIPTYLAPDRQPAVARYCSLKTIEGVAFVHGEGETRFRLPLLWRLMPMGIALSRLNAGRTRIGIVNRDGSNLREVRALRLGETTIIKSSDLW